MASTVELTFYERTGYSFSDEPANESVIDSNVHWTTSYLLKEYDPSNVKIIKTSITDDEAKRVDYLKITDVYTNQRWYFFKLRHTRVNDNVLAIEVMIDNFSTVGLSNIRFFGNIVRRSLSAQETVEYPHLPEPWAPRRPLLTRRIILDLNVNKSIRVPSHISTTFEEETTHIEHPDNPLTIQVPNSPLLGSYITDSLSFVADLPMIYPNAAANTTHTVVSPWGNLEYVTPYETYFNISGTALSTFLAKAKKANALDLLESPYYLPAPAQTHAITLSEVSHANIKNSKASKWYTTITIRSLASNSSRTYSDNEVNLNYNFSFTAIIAPDKNGGIYLLPTTLRGASGLNAYSYLEGIYSPFESVVHNAVGDTPAKFAADGTIALNTALNNVFQTYINKVNALQIEQMQAKYFKDLGAVKGLVMAFAAEALASTSETTTITEGFEQLTDIETFVPEINQTSTQTQRSPDITQQVTGTNTTAPWVQYNDGYSSNWTPNSSTYGSTYSGTGQTTQNAYSYNIADVGRLQSMPTIISHNNPGRADTNSTTYTENGGVSTGETHGNTRSDTQTQTSTGLNTTLAHNVQTDVATNTNAYNQRATQTSIVPQQVTHSVTTNDSAERAVADGVNIAQGGVKDVFDGIDHWDTLRGFVFGGYRNEMHSFMLGNLNDYLSRWVSIQNDIHNGKVANLFKNVTLVGGYQDYNKVAGKYEILISYLNPNDETNFDLFLSHFGHATDEYSNQLVRNVNPNYNYTMVGDDAMITNTVKQDANSAILAQFRTGVRVWNVPIIPENF